MNYIRLTCSIGFILAVDAGGTVGHCTAGEGADCNSEL